ncbi:SpoIVB peptidase [Alkalithermobacter paradoxus]|uniref:SpoIVB peptidase n=1 Tax=Alkalithermobacter paradoxus TaxID=29349 RepID=UPI001301B222
MIKFTKNKILMFLLLSAFAISTFVQSNLNIEALNRNKLYVIPLGYVAGIRLDTKGVLVIGMDSEILKQRNRDLKVGDIITKIEDTEVNKASEIEDILNSLKKEYVNVTLKRDGVYIDKKVKVSKDARTNKYKMGVWVRDRVAGIGTLTYYNPINGSFGALGHGITDVDTGRLIEIKSGKIYRPSRIRVKKGKIGSPGELSAEFTDSVVIGNFDSNTNFGIKGKIEDTSDFMNLKPLEVAEYHQVKKGNAYILFPDENNKIRKYDVIIDKIFSQNSPESKSMVIEIVDKDLIEYTGGIVQGMSGAPIIQDDKLVGAITHVFVNDPKKGYGIFAKWMVK